MENRIELRTSLKCDCCGRHTLAEIVSTSINGKPFEHSMFIRDKRFGQKHTLKVNLDNIQDLVGQLGQPATQGHQERSSVPPTASEAVPPPGGLHDAKAFVPVSA